MPIVNLVLGLLFLMIVGAFFLKLIGLAIALGVILVLGALLFPKPPI